MVALFFHNQLINEIPKPRNTCFISKTSILGPVVQKLEKCQRQTRENFYVKIHRILSKSYSRHLLSSSNSLQNIKAIAYLLFEIPSTQSFVSTFEKEP